MANDLIGDLSKTRLFDLIKPLLDRKKSGMVMIKRNEIVELYIEGGNIIHGKCGSLTGEEAILAMMEWDTGRVTFDWQTAAEEQTVYMPTEQLLAIWTIRENEWKKIRELIPSSNATFQIPISNSPEDKNIQATQWRILALCNGTRTVSEIAEILKLQLFEISQIMYKMVQDGLLERASDKTLFQKLQVKKTVNENCVPIIENELKKIMGPLASIIIDDILADFGESKDAFPEDRLPPFVQAVSEEITDKSKRALFTKIVTEFITQNHCRPR